MTQLKIPCNIFEEMLRQAKAEAPIEACGILAGKEGLVEKFYEMTNTDQSSKHFMMLPEEQFKVVKDIRAAGLKMLAIYHSHPETPARLSQEDIRLAVTPDVVYVIVSLQKTDRPDVKGFTAENGKISEVPIEIMKVKNG